MLFFCSIVYGQPAKILDYFATSSDTVFCTELSYGTEEASGELNYIKFTDIHGKNWEFKTKENIPDILTFHIGDFVYHKEQKKNKAPVNFAMADLPAQSYVMKDLLAQDSLKSKSQTIENLFVRDSLKSISRKLEKPLAAEIIIQDSVKIFVHQVITGTMVHSQDAFSAPGDAMHSHWSSSSQKVKRLFFKIGEQDEKMLSGKDYKIFREYISSNKNAKKYFKRYVICGWTSVGGFASVIIGLPVLLFAPPAGVICIGAGFVTMITAKQMGNQFLFKSAKIFNSGLKNQMTL